MTEAFLSVIAPTGSVILFHSEFERWSMPRSAGPVRT